MERLRRLAADLPRPALAGRVAHVDDNLVVGFFARAGPGRPRAGGNVFIMHAGSVRQRRAAGPGRRGDSLRSFAGVQDLPLTYVVVLEERGAIYYLSSVPGAAGLAAVPG